MLANVIVGHGSRRGKGRRHTVAQSKHGTVPLALDLSGGRIHFTFGEAEILVTAPIIEHINIVFNPNDYQDATLNPDLTGFTAHEIVQRADIDGDHGVTIRTEASTEVTSASTNSANSSGRATSISLKKP